MSLPSPERYAVQVQTMTPETEFNELFERLYAFYRQERPNSTLTHADLETLLIVFPAVLVIKSDMFVDTQEMNYVQKMARELAQNYQLEISEAFAGELRYLTRDTTYWREPFLRTAKPYIAMKGIQAAIVDVMILAASSSSGDLLQNLALRARRHNIQTRQTGLPDLQEEVDFIDDDEKKTIRSIARELDLYLDKEAAKTLSVQLQ
ncbi:MAG: hypothetical protein ACOCZ8_00605 [Bacteroidota bacterium]